MVRFIRLAGMTLVCGALMVPLLGVPAAQAAEILPCNTSRPYRDLNGDGFEDAVVGDPYAPADQCADLSWCGGWMISSKAASRPTGSPVPHTAAQPVPDGPISSSTQDRGEDECVSRPAALMDADEIPLTVSGSPVPTYRTGAASPAGSSVPARRRPGRGPAQLAADQRR